MTIQFGHQCLAEAHHLTFAFAFWIEVRTPFATAHRQGCQGVFKGLFKAEEFQNREVYGRVEAHPAFERPDSRAELDAPCAVHLNLITVVYPHHAELNDALRFNQSFQQGKLTIARVLLEERPEGRHDFAYGLSKLGLVWVALLNMSQEGIKGASLVHKYKYLL